MTHSTRLLIAACLFGLASGVSFAKGGGGMGGPHGSPGGLSAQHMSSQGTQNTNGPSALDRDTGLARSGDRRGMQGTEHFQAGSAQTRHKAHPGKGRVR